METKKQLLAELSKLLGAGHRSFGKVAPRRPYQDDDRDSGGSQLLFKEHPLLSSLPLGASSDLTFLINDNKFSVDAAEQRYNEAKPELQKALDYVLGMHNRPQAMPKPEL